MLGRLLATALVSVLSACSGDSTVVVARLNRSTPSDAALPADDGGGGVDTDAVGGPAGALWWPYSEPGGSSEWGGTPTPDSVSLVARAPADVRAGLEFQFNRAGTVVDLSTYDRLGLTVAVTEGDMFELFLGRGVDVGCSYVFSRGQSNAYSASLSQPSWCKPTQCGFDLRVTGGLFLAHVPSDSRLTATLSDLTFFSSSPGARAGSASGLGGTMGPGGFCWFLVKWNNADASWVLPAPTSSAVEVSATARSNGIAGMAFEVPSSFNLAQYRTLTIDATVSNGSTQAPAPFLVQAVSLDRGRGWQLQGEGKPRSYRIDLTQPEYTFTGSSGVQLGLNEVNRIEIVTKSNGGDAKIDARVVNLSLQ